MCKFTYSLKFICNPQTKIHDAFTVIRGRAQNRENFERPAVLVASWDGKGDSVHARFKPHAGVARGLAGGGQRSIQQEVLALGPAGRGLYPNLACTC